jgi:hypothetical protein
MMGACHVRFDQGSPEASKPSLGIRKEGYGHGREPVAPTSVPHSLAVACAHERCRVRTSLTASATAAGLVSGMLAWVASGIPRT